VARTLPSFVFHSFQIKLHGKIDSGLRSDGIHTEIRLSHFKKKIDDGFEKFYEGFSTTEEKTDSV